MGRSSHRFVAIATYQSAPRQKMAVHMHRSLNRKRKVFLVFSPMGKSAVAGSKLIKLILYYKVLHFVYVAFPPLRVGAQPCGKFNCVQ